nr:hypothetical protein [Tanacetum cinerariifolium]
VWRGASGLPRLPGRGRRHGGAAGAGQPQHLPARQPGRLARPRTAGWRRAAGGRAFACCSAATATACAG